MTDLAARFFLLFMALGVLGIGLWGLADPADMLASIGVGLTGAGGTIEGRAMYGGLQLGMAVPIGLGALSPTWRRPSLLVSACYLAGIGSGRLVGILLSTDSVATAFWGLTAFELGSAVAALGLWAALRR